MGLGEIMLLNSAVQPLKTVAWRVVMVGPAGYQYSEQAPVAPVVWHGCKDAWAGLMDGRWKLLETGPATAARENATERTSTSLRSVLTFKAYSVRKLAS